MLYRLREVYSVQDYLLSSTVEVDETFVGGLETNNHLSKKPNAGRGGNGRSIVVGVKEGRSRICQIKCY